MQTVRKVMGLRRNRRCEVKVKCGEQTVCVGVQPEWVDGQWRLNLDVPEGTTIINHRSPAPTIAPRRPCSPPEHRCRRT
jgi:hypothetical protein